ncbi:MAG: hypothetical protein WKF47_14420 [Geodermatophilaceae bacterium]
MPRCSARVRRCCGTHDFAAYCRRRDNATTIRELQHLTIQRAGHLLEVDVQADAFCHSMVRSLVGALLAVGDGRRSADWPASLLTLPDPGRGRTGRPGSRTDPGRGRLPTRRPASPARTQTTRADRDRRGVGRTARS